MNNKIYEAKQRIWWVYMKARNSFMYGDKMFPRMITVETQSSCNRQCYYCVNSIHPQTKGSMSDKMVSLCLFRLAELKFKGCLVFSHFSEPLLEPRLSELIRLANEKVKGCYPLVYTNGDFLSEGVLLKLIKAGVKFVSVTKHPPFSKEWDDNIAYLLKRYPKYIQFRGELEVEWRFNFCGTVPNPPKARRWNCCPVLKWNMAIYHNGDIPLCTNAPDRWPIMGNIVEQKIIDIWRKPNFIALRKQANKEEPTFELCKKCFDR